MVSREQIEDIRQRINLVRLVEQVVPLKRAGRHHLGLCPFHQEKSPSFTVSEDKQLYHCFGCGVGGTVYNFLMDYYHLSFPEALQRGAELAGVELQNQSEEEAKKSKLLSEKKKKLFHIMDLVADTYHRVLKKSPNASAARKYAESRNLSSTTLDTFKIGFSPESWDNLTRYLSAKKISLDEARQIGLITEKRGGGYVDFFRNRLIFPIRDGEGRTIGLGGRVLGSGQPKYLNSPQSLLFDKGKNLFGIYEAQEAIRKHKSVIVTEGYMDQIALYQAGVHNVVATLGTALTEYHAKLLRRHTHRVTLVFDGDSAGVKATLKAMRPLMSEGLSANVVELPEGEDADSYVKTHGPEKFRKLVENAKPVMKFYIDRFYLAERDVVKKSEAIKEMMGLVNSCDALLKEALVKELKDTAGLGEDFLRSNQLDHKAVRRPIGPVSAQRSTDAHKFLNEELLLLRTTLEVGEAMKKIFDEDTFSLFSSEKLAQLSKEWLRRVDAERKSAPGNWSVWIEFWEDAETKSDIRKILMSASLDSLQDWDKIWMDCVSKLKRRKLSFLRKEIAEAEMGGRDQDVQKLSREVLALKKSFESAKP